VDAASAARVAEDPPNGDVKVVEGEEEGGKKKKRVKEKVGFRDRKVIHTLGPPVGVHNKLVSDV
jgi:DNA replication initiation complex subunit (GINS family)